MVLLLYGLKSSGAAFHAKLAGVLDTMGYQPHSQIQMYGYAKLPNLVVVLQSLDAVADDSKQLSKTMLWLVRIWIGPWGYDIRVLENRYGRRPNGACSFGREVARACPIRGRTSSWLVPETNTDTTSPAFLDRSERVGIRTPTP